MEYGILWILALLSSLLLTALAAALFSSFNRKLWRILGMLAVVGAMSFLFGLFSLLTSLMFYNNLIVPSWLFPYNVSFFLAYLIASIFILRRSLSTKAGLPPGRDWKRAVITSACFACLILTLTTFNLIDLNRQIEFSNVNSYLKTRLLEFYPPKPPSELNAYTLYKQVSNALDEEEKAQILDFVKTDRDPTAPEIKALLGRNQQFVEMLHQAIKRPSYYGGSPYESSLILLSPPTDITDYHVMADLLGLRSKVEVLSGNYLGAIEELKAIRSMVNHLQRAPDFFLWFMSLAVTKQECDFLEYLLARTPSVNELFSFPIKATPSVFQSCRGLVFQQEATELQLPFLMMQRKDTMDDLLRIYNEMYESFGATPPVILPYILHPVPRSVWRVFFGKSYLDEVRDKWKRINKITEPAFRRWRDLVPLRKELEGKRESLLNFILMYDNYTFDSVNQNTSVLIYIDRIARLDAYRRIMDGAVAVSAYRESKGTYPETVDDLVPEFLETILIDPYDGKPLKMKKVQGGLDLYSIGPVSRDLDGNSSERMPIHFYVGVQAYEKYRVDSAKIIKAKKELKSKYIDKNKEVKPSIIAPLNTKKD